MIVVSCVCGEVFHADDSHAGRQIACRCGKRVTIPAKQTGPKSVATPVASSTRYSNNPAWSTGARTTPIRPLGQARGPDRSFLPWIAVGAAAVLLGVLTRQFGRQDSTSAVEPGALPVQSPFESLARDTLCSPDTLDRPRTSSELGGSHRGGRSQLRVANGTNHDAVVVLVSAPNGPPRRAIYVRSGETGVVTEVPSGHYRLRFQLGETLLAESRRFCAVHSTSEFDRDLDFDRTATEDGWEYSSWEVTLHAVPDGNASMSSIPAGKFELPAWTKAQAIDTLHTGGSHRSANTKTSTRP